MNEKFDKAVHDLELCGFLEHVDSVAPGVYTATETVGWLNVARELAAALPGQTRATQGGSAWQYGNKIGGTIIDPSHLPKIEAARETMRQVGALVPGKQYWSVGVCARAGLAWVGQKQAYDRRVEEIIAKHPYGYHECEPGVYASPVPRWLPSPKRDLFDDPVEYINPDYKEAVTLYDVDSFYYTLLDRLPSLRVAVMPGGKARFFPMLPGDRERWRTLLHAVYENKVLRNSIAGCAAGTLKPGTAYTSSRPRDKNHPDYVTWTPGTVRRIKTPPMPGPFRAAGLLVVATAAELCYRQAAACDCLYASVDSVAVRGGERPRVWEGYGLTVSVKATGDAHICHRGSWKIGPRPTRNYRKGYHQYIPEKRVEVPQTYYHQWL